MREWSVAGEVGVACDKTGLSQRRVVRACARVLGSGCDISKGVAQTHNTTSTIARH